MRARVATTFLATSCLFLGIAHADEDDIRHTNKSIQIANDGRAGELHSVNGSIDIGDRAVTAAAKAVNGSVRIGDDSRAQALGTVNGAVSVGKRTIIETDVTSVNGRLVVSENATVRGNAKNVNSSIAIGPGAHVGGKIITTNGDITLQDNARVDGGIHVKGDVSGWFKDFFGSSRRPVVTIGPGAEVGDLVFDRDVELRVHVSAKIGTVTGASVERY